jgi:hypothetical protein
MQSAQHILRQQSNDDSIWHNFIHLDLYTSVGHSLESFNEIVDEIVDVQLFFSHTLVRDQTLTPH